MIFGSNMEILFFPPKPIWETGYHYLLLSPNWLFQKRNTTFLKKLFKE